MEDNNDEFNAELDPAIIKIRDQIIKKIGDKPLEEVNDVIKKLLREQMDEVTRLGALAARVKIIRAKINELYENKKKVKKLVKEISKPKDEKVEKAEEKTDDWVRLKMLESAEVNNKQIDKDVVLDVKKEEAKKLIDAKKAEIHKDEQIEKDVNKKEDLNKEVKTEEIKVADNQNKKEVTESTEKDLPPKKKSRFI